MHSPERIQSGMLDREPDEESQQQEAAAPAHEQSSSELPPYIDPAEPLLRAHGIDDDTAATVWDIFHSARDSKVLIEKLQPLDIPNATKHELVVAKQKGDPAPDWLTRLDKAVEAVNKVAQLHATPARDGKSVLQLGEKHPNVMKALANAALKHEE